MRWSSTPVPGPTISAWALAAALVTATACGRDSARPVSPAPASPAAAGAAYLPFLEAAPILDAHNAILPAELKGLSGSELAARWTAWVARRDAQIRARLAAGEEESLVNFWLFGTSFTSQPRVTADEVARLGSRDRVEELLLARLDDLVAGLASPGSNERLHVARQIIEAQGIDPATLEGQQRARLYLVAARERILQANARYRRAAASARRPGGAIDQESLATWFRDRGLSTDTSVPVEFAVHQALETIARRGGVPAGRLARVAVIGPGLDFTDKAEGVDFYPPQTIQPFALVDSLVGLGLARPGELDLAALDVSPRVIRHLDEAGARARAGVPYLLHLSLRPDFGAHQQNPDLVSYWQRLGDRIGDNTAPLPVPSTAGPLRVRAVRVRPAIVASITALEVNIILQRLEPRSADDLFDLIVATNVLVYYDRFEQALALANISRMLKPGGLFLTNYAVAPSATLERLDALTTRVFFDKGRTEGDSLFWYRRR